MRVLVLGLVVTGSLWATSAGASAADYDPQIAAARQYLTWLREGDFNQCEAAGDSAMKAALPADKLEQTWKQITAALGEYQGEIRAETTETAGLVVVTLHCRFANSGAAIRVSVNDEGQVAGLFFSPSSEGVEYEPPAYVDPSAFREVPISVTTGDISLPGTLTLPRGDGPHPAAVLVHGSGPHDQDETIFLNKPFKDLAWGLATEGVAVLRYEKRTKKYGATIDVKTLTLDQETVDDAIAAVQLLRERDDVREDRVFIVGHSLGASAAPRMASKEPAIAGVVMLAAAARPLYDLIEDQTRYSARLQPDLDDEQRAELDEILSGVQKLREGTWKPGDTVLGMPAEYWIAIDRELQPVAHAKKCARPMLIAHCGRDYQVTQKDFDVWTSQLAGRDNVTLKRFDNLDHLLRAGDGPSTPAQYLQKGHVDIVVIKTISKWISARD